VGTAVGDDEATTGHCEPVALPYVFRYLTNELAGMNIRMTLQMDGWKA
jgi:DNA-directed RNA polymerase beta subunit